MVFVCTFKGTVHTKLKKYCHHVLSLKLFQTCINLFVLLNTKENILKNVCYHSCRAPLTSILWKRKKSSLVFSRTKKCIQVWNNLRVSKWWHISFWGWTIPLICFWIELTTVQKFVVGKISLDVFLHLIGQKLLSYFQ